MLHVAECCVFRLRAQGLAVVGVASGIDPTRGVLARMSLRPLLPRVPRLMDARIFEHAPLGLRGRNCYSPIQGSGSSTCVEAGPGRKPAP